MLGGIALAFACVITGVIIVIRTFAPLRMRMKQLETSLDAIPFEQATRDLERLQYAIDGLQGLVTRVTRWPTKK